MATQPTSIDRSFRSVTPEEIASYQKFGWVKLKAFIPRPKVDELLSMAKDRMGEQGDRNLPPEAFSDFNPLTLRGFGHPLMGPIIAHCGRGARALMARRARVGIRYFTDYFAVKQPAKKKQAGRGGAGGSDWHQDYAASASDRSGGMVFWTALTDMPPEKGTMAFLNGSQRVGVMGHYSTYGNGNLLDSWVLLRNCPHCQLGQWVASGKILRYTIF